MTQLNELKAKYPLAVKYLKGKDFTIEDYQEIAYLYSSEFSIGIDISTKEPLNNSPAQDEIGKMLAEILNLIAKP